MIQDAEPNSEGFCHWFATASGTSMAAPHVAGAFALLRDAFPTRSVDEIEAALDFSGVQITDPDNGVTRSRIQVDAAYDILANGATGAQVSLTPIEPFRTAGQSGDPDSFASKTYTLRNTAASPRAVRIDSQPDWISVSSSAFTIPPGGQRTLTLSIDTTGLPEAADSGLVVIGNNFNDPIEIPVSIQVEQTGGVAEFGPYEWVGDIGNTTGAGDARSVFRIIGLEDGMPVSIRVAIDSPALGEGTDSFDDCSLTLRAARYSGSEYLITPRDLLDCGGFRRANLRFRVSVADADALAGLRMRRFTTNPSGGISDLSFDSEGTNAVDAGAAEATGADMDSLTRLGEDSVWAAAASVPAGTGEADAPAATGKVEFGPFEWAGDSTATTASIFRIAGLDTAAPTAIDVAIDHASTDGYDGEFTDCSLTIRAGAYGSGEYIIDADDLADCGSFGRADLSFRVTADSADVGDLTMRRIATTATGGMSDFAFDLESSYATRLTSVNDTEGQAVFGPFEWTGDANAPTASVFRIVGFVSGMPTRIDVQVLNALSGDYDEKFTDCSLTIRPDRQSGSEYLIYQSDLADCGDFGRADLRFRVRAVKTDVSPGLLMRRIAVGAGGDLTDFRFDHTPGSNARSIALPAGASAGMAAVEFGPFEWTGDRNAPTGSVFRISGLDSGAPERIDVALANATTGDFAGTYDDCSLQIRAARIGPGEFVIGAQDWRDCGSFGRRRRQLPRRRRPGGCGCRPHHAPLRGDQYWRADRFRFRRRRGGGVAGPGGFGVGLAVLSWGAVDVGWGKS